VAGWCATIAPKVVYVQVNIALATSNQYPTANSAAAVLIGECVRGFGDAFKLRFALEVQ
jgi:hypothetical protein